MSKRNLNEVLGFISRWGDSDFSLNLLDEALTSAALEKAAMMAEKDKPTSIRAKQLRARGIKRLADEKKLEAIIKDKSPQNQAKREKALRIRDKMTSFEDTEFDPKLKGQVTGKGSRKPVIVGGKKQTFEKPQPETQTEKPEKPQPATQTEKPEKPQPTSTKQTKPKTKSGADIIDVVHGIVGAGSNILAGTRAFGGLMSAPAGTPAGDVQNISTVVTGVTTPIRQIQALFSGRKIPRRNQPTGQRRISLTPDELKGIIASKGK